ncbi:MAG TPA: hypothetical protein VJL33_01290 [Candidatus Bathyarchaeia archaeon]|nr:hypothetical protein [Candidatus Bathyarchaeia archaeon]
MELLGRSTVAYLRQEKETVEIDYPLSKVWEAMPKALALLDWTLEQSDDEAHHAKVKTKSAFMSYSSVLIVDAVSVNEKMCRVTVKAETPVTTITAVADFGRSRERIQLFFAMLAKQLNNSENA